MRKTSVINLALLLCLSTATAGFAFPKTDHGPSAPAAADMKEKKTEQDKSTGNMDLMIDRKEAKKIVAAKVNGAVITMDSVVSMMARINSKKTPAQPPESVDDIMKKALDRLIFQELAYQTAKSENMKVEQKKVDAVMDNMKKTMGEEGYKKHLETEGLTEEELKTKVKRNLLIELIFAKEVKDKSSVSEEEIKEEYEKEKDKFIILEKGVLTDVVFFLDNDDINAMSKAEDVLKKINEDADKDPWKLLSDGTFIVRDIDINKDREKEKELYEEAVKMKVGEVSGIIKTSDSLHIIKLKEYSPEKQTPLENVRGLIESNLRAKAQRQMFEKWNMELKKGAQIEIIESKK